MYENKAFFVENVFCWKKMKYLKIGKKTANLIKNADKMVTFVKKLPFYDQILGFWKKTNVLKLVKTSQCDIERTWKGKFS